MNQTMSIQRTVLRLFLVLLAVVSCSVPIHDSLNLQYMESVEGVEALSSEILVGETSGEEVVELLGTPFSIARDQDGYSQLSYIWRTTPIRTKASWSEIDLTFDPRQSSFKDSDFSYNLSSDKVQLLVGLNQEGLVQEKVVARTPTDCVVCHQTYH